MKEPVSLLFGVHAHQPVGNFPQVIEQAHERCYRPFLRTLHRFPEFRFSAHFSGWLLDFLYQHYPQDMALLSEMAARGQVELFGGGDCEPVLAAISSRDRSGQLLNLSDKLERRFGQRPAGAWLTERVWESTLVPELADAGIRYVTVDDYHFLCTGRVDAELHGYYTTEENGRRLDLFPISEVLRYRLPFSPAPDAVRYLESLAEAGHDAAIYFDDIEKFGIWPETYEWVYERGWLEQFISGALAAPRVTSATYAEFHHARATRGIVYLPATSYSEMGTWTLPAGPAAILEELLEREKASGELERHRPFLRGGIWRNFFSRYPESNWMHKRMLALSLRLAAVAPDNASLRELLYRAQANDAYWHGLFGGLYLPHLRRSVYHHLLSLERALDTLAPRPAFLRDDIDLDGHEEIFLTGAQMQVVARADGLAAIIELDDYALRHNFGDTLRRYEEHYHRKLTEAPQAAASAGGIASAHERIGFKHDITPADATPDDAPRALFIDRSIDSRGVRQLINGYIYDGAREGAGMLIFRHAESAWQLEKRIGIIGRQLAVSYHFHGQAPAGFECQINLAMPSADGYSGRYILADGTIPCGFGQHLKLDSVSIFTLDDRHMKGSVIVRASSPVALSAEPHHTVSQSEAGFEKVMQAVCLSLSFTPVAGSETIIVLELAADHGP